MHTNATYETKGTGRSGQEFDSEKMHPGANLPTTDVPPQWQADWTIEELEKADALRKLPQELFDMVAGHVREGTITREQAEADRDALMKERSEFVIEHNERVYEIEFNMCEH